MLTVMKITLSHGRNCSALYGFFDYILLYSCIPICTLIQIPEAHTPPRELCPDSDSEGICLAVNINVQWNAHITQYSSTVYIGMAMGGSAL